jgi:ABC-type branched-subunit amino acid transport system permease subunit
VAAVFGVIGSIPGALIGGVILGVIENLTKAYISSQLSDAVVFSVLIIVLLVRPTGILGKKITEKVEVGDMKNKKALKQNVITYGMVIAFWAVIQIMMKTGNLSSLAKGLLVPICMYVILAVSLNLTVGILGELSLGHAGFMCVGAFSGAFFTKVAESAIPSVGVRFFIALLIGAAVAGLCGFLIGIPVLRLKGDYLAIVTLAFGEIIKNLINVMYVGVDQHGFHFSIKDTTSLGMDDTGVVIIKGAQGITGTPKAATFTVSILLVLVPISAALVNGICSSYHGVFTNRSLSFSICPAAPSTINPTQSIRRIFTFVSSSNGISAASFGINLGSVVMIVLPAALWGSSSLV